MGTSEGVPPEVPPKAGVCDPLGQALRCLVTCGQGTAPNDIHTLLKRFPWQQGLQSLKPVASSSGCAAEARSATAQRCMRG